MDIAETLMEELDGQAQGDNIMISCPFCADRIGTYDQGRHLGVNPDKGVYHCFRCDVSGTARRLISELIHMGLLHAGVGSLTTLSPSKMARRRLTRKSPTESGVYDGTVPFRHEDLGFHIMNPPISYIGDPAYDVYRYCVGRGLNDKLIRRHKLMWADGDDYRGYLIIPYFEDDKFVYFNARALGDRKPRYKNPDKEKYGTNQQWIFGIDYIRQMSWCVICEGVINAIIFGDGAVAVGGHYLSTTQYYKLKSLQLSVVYLAYDKDAMVDAVDTAHWLISNGIAVGIIVLCDEDFCDMGKDAARGLIDTATVCHDTLELEQQWLNQLGGDLWVSMGKRRKRNKRQRSLRGTHSWMLSP